MGKTVTLVALCTFFSGVAAAGPCVPGTLDDYINLGATGCTQGAYTFQDFYTLPGITGGSEISPGLVLVTPGGSAQLEFLLDQSAVAGELYQSFFRFTVVGALSAAEIRLNDPTASGDGAVTGILDVCADGFFFPSEPLGCPSTAQTVITAHIDGFSEPVATAFLPSSSFFDVFVDLTVDGGLEGTASLHSGTVTFGEGGQTVIPEPSSALLLAAGLGVVGMLRRRRAN